MNADQLTALAIAAAPPSSSGDSYCYTAIDAQEIYEQAFMKAVRMISSQGDRLVINGMVPTEDELFNLLTVE
jgi:hypothetical protein